MIINNMLSKHEKRSVSPQSVFLYNYRVVLFVVLRCYELNVVRIDYCFLELSSEIRIDRMYYVTVRAVGILS